MTIAFIGGISAPTGSKFGVAPYDKTVPLVVPVTDLNYNSVVYHLPMQANLLETKGNVASIVNTVVLSADSPYVGGNSAYFNGANSHMEIAHIASSNLGSGNFTIECWAKKHPSDTGSSVLISKPGYGTTSPYLLAYNSDLKLNFLGSYAPGGDWNIIDTTVGTYSVSVWRHYAWVRNGTSFKGYINGVQVTSSVHSSALQNDVTPMFIGDQGANASPFQGWIADVRLTVGIARYTAPFTPNTEPFPTA